MFGMSGEGLKYPIRGGGGKGKKLFLQKFCLYFLIFRPHFIDLGEKLDKNLLRGGVLLPLFGQGRVTFLMGDSFSPRPPMFLLLYRLPRRRRIGLLHGVGLDQRCCC